MGASVREDDIRFVGLRAPRSHQHAIATMIEVRKVRRDHLRQIMHRAAYDSLFGEAKDAFRKGSVAPKIDTVSILVEDRVWDHIDQRLQRAYLLRQISLRQL